MVATPRRGVAHDRNLRRLIGARARLHRLRFLFLLRPGLSLDLLHRRSLRLRLRRLISLGRGSLRRRRGGGIGKLGRLFGGLGLGALGVIVDDIAGVAAEVKAVFLVVADGQNLAGQAALACGASGVEQGAALGQHLAALFGKLDRSLNGLAASLLREALVFALEDVEGLTRHDAVEDALEVRAAQRLLFEEQLHQLIQVIAVLRKDGVGLFVRTVEQVVHLLVDALGDVVRVLDGAAGPTVGKRVSLFLAVLHGAEIRAEAVLGEHGTRDLRSVLDIRGRTRGRRAEDELLRGTAAQGEDEAREEFVARVHALVVFLGRHGVAAGATAREDGHLIHALDVLHRPRGERVAALVVRGDLLFVLGDDLGLAARATHHAVRGLFQRVRRNDISADARREQRRLVEDVCQVRAGHTGGTLGQLLDVDIFRQRFTFGVDLENLLAAGKIRVGHRDLAVEAARAQQRLVEDVRAVGRRDEDDALAVAEAVHLHEELVQRLLALIVAAAGTSATAGTTHGVDLVNEDDARRLRLGLLEQVAHAGGTDTDEHLHEVRARDGEERHARLACDGAREQCLTGARRAVEKDAARNLRAERVVAFRVLEEVLDLHELFHGLVRTGHVLKRVGGHVLGELLGLGATNAEQAAGAALHARHEEEEQTEDDEHGQDEGNHRADERLLRHLGLVLVRAGILHGVEDLLGGAGRVLGDDLFDAVALLDRDGRAQLETNLLLAVVDLGLRDILVLQLGQRHGGVDLHVGTRVISKERKRVQRDEHEARDRAVADDAGIFH